MVVSKKVDGSTPPEMAVSRGVSEISDKERRQGKLQLRRTLRDAEVKQLSEWLTAEHRGADAQLARAADAQLRSTQARATLEVSRDAAPWCSPVWFR